VIAYAGTGKTTTLQMISDAMPERRGMYLAFNKAIASEAQKISSQCRLPYLSLTCLSQCHVA
jgi:ABC-type proline/glycine betaine transport system ATPase subunit